MNSRLDKYYQDDTKVNSRQARNKRLYSEIDQEKFNLNSNISILDDDGNNIDLSKLKNILDEKYNEEVVPKRMNYVSEEEDVEYLDVTRDYDINSILEKAKEKQEVNYESDRLKKARMDHVDILNDLEITHSKIDTDKSAAKELTSLIEKININEKTSSNLLSDLIGDGETSVIPAINDNLDADLEVVEENKARIREIEKDKEEVKEETLSKSLLFNTEDFKEFKDLDSNKTMSPIGIIFSILIIGGLLFGIFYMLNKLLGWNIF